MTKADIDELVLWMEKYCEQVSVTGEARCGQPCEIVRILAVPKMESPPDAGRLADSKVNLLEQAIAQRAVKERSSGDQVFRIPSGMFQVIYTTNGEWASMLVKTTGPKEFLIEIYTMLKGMGYRWIGSGFTRLEGEHEARFEPKDEEEFFSWIGMPWSEPEMRKFGPLYWKDMPDNPNPISHDELRAWRDESKWVKSTCGGEAHEYTVRTAQKDEEMFCRVANTIYEYGYDGSYLGRTWRYLDCDGYRYFAVDFRIAETSLINRKPFFTVDHKVRPWVLNPRRLHRMSMMDPARKERHANPDKCFALKIKRAIDIGDGVGLETTDGNFSVESKKRWMDRGAASLFPTNRYWGDDFSKRLREIVINESVITCAMTDPLLVCLVRRAWTARNKRKGPRVKNLDIPTYAEAEAELASGKDKYGGKWPIPILPSVAFFEWEGPTHSNEGVGVSP